MPKNSILNSKDFRKTIPTIVEQLMTVAVSKVKQERSDFPSDYMDQKVDEYFYELEEEAQDLVEIFADTLRKRLEAHLKVRCKEEAVKLAKQKPVVTWK